MHIKEYVHLEHIKDRLEMIQSLFYRDLKNAEPHNHLGQLYQYILDVINETDKVEID